MLYIHTYNSNRNSIGSDSPEGPNTVGMLISNAGEWGCVSFKHNEHTPFRGRPWTSQAQYVTVFVIISSTMVLYCGRLSLPLSSNVLQVTTSSTGQPWFLATLQRRDHPEKVFPLSTSLKPLFSSIQGPPPSALLKAGQGEPHILGKNHRWGREQGRQTGASLEGPESPRANSSTALFSTDMSI